MGAHFPNPAAQQVSVPVVLEPPAELRIEVYDLLGRRVAQLADAHMAAGEHVTEWSARG